MVTEAGKELLRASINTANFHNKILEENIMWKQWELECGLTMMVSDDDILKKIRKNHQCSKHRFKDKYRFRSDELPSASTSSSSKDNVSDRWDHSGFKELYPDEVVAEKSSSSSSPSHKSKHKKKNRKKHRSSKSDDDEVWKEFLAFKRSKMSKSSEKKEEKCKRPASGFDNHIKEWKKMKDKLKN